MPLDSQSVLVSSDMLSPVESLVSDHSGSDLESETASDWLSWILPSSSVNNPSLVSAVVAFVPNTVSSV